MPQGRGTFKTIFGTNPAAGAQLNEVVPAGKWWRLVSFRCLLATSATVANRFVVLQFAEPGGSNYYNCGTNVAQTASQFIDYNAFPGNVMGQSNAGADMQIPVPIDAWLGPGHLIKSFIQNGQAGDDWGQPTYVVE